MDAALLESGRVNGGSEEGEDCSSSGGRGDDYLRSGLFSSLAMQRTVKSEPRSELHEEVSSSVIRFRTNCGHSSQPCTPPPAVPSVEMFCAQDRSSPRSLSSPDSSDQPQPLNLSSGRHRQRLSTPERKSPAMSRKPEGLDISGSSHLFLAGSDIVSIALKSPALPSGTLTPAFFTTQGQIQVGFLSTRMRGRKLLRRTKRRRVC